MAAILFDLGGTHLRCAVLADSPAIQNSVKMRIESFLAGIEPSRIWTGLIVQLVRYVESVRHLVPVDAPVVISFPGPVAYPSRILDAPTVVGEGSSFPDLCSEIQRITGRAAYIINDVSAAAWYFGKCFNDLRRFMVVTVSSGIGSKIFDRQHPRGVIDDVPYAGEIGHAVVDCSPDAVLCDCGGKGHLGAISSGRGIERWARRAAQSEPHRFAASACSRSLGGKIDLLTNEDHIIPAARLNDEWTMKVIEKCTYPLVKVVLSVSLAMGIERVILIGGFAQALGQIYLDIFESIFNRLCDYPYYE